MSGLDRSCIDTSNPSAYVRCIDFCNEPMMAFKNIDKKLEHYFITMGLITDKVALLNKHTFLKILINGELLLLSGTLFDWYNSIVLSCSNKNELTPIMCQAMIILEGAGFRDLFSKYKKEYINDKNFILFWR